MRLAVISDMHGNCVALDAVLADIEREDTDGIVCLGDAVQGGPQPKETVERLRSLGCPVVMGNADAWLLSGINTGTEEAISPVQLDVRAWQLQQLSPEDKSLIQGFQPTVELELEGGNRLLCFHGSPASFDDLIFPETSEEDFQAMLGPYEGAIMCGGHTHLQQIRRIGPAFFFNPGSVGAAFNRTKSDANFHTDPHAEFHFDPWAEYTILTSERGRTSLEFRHVLYDVDELLNIYRQSGRPHIERALREYGKG